MRCNARSAWTSSWILLPQNKMAVGQDTSLLVICSLRILKIREKTILKKIGVFAFRNSPISRHRWDRNDMSMHFATAVPVGFMFYRENCVSYALEQLTTVPWQGKWSLKQELKTCTVYFDHIWNAEWLSYQIQDEMQYLNKNVNPSTTRTR